MSITDPPTSPITYWWVWPGAEENFIEFCRSPLSAISFPMVALK